jgi:hypothetical protein
MENISFLKFVNLTLLNLSMLFYAAHFILNLRIIFSIGIYYFMLSKCHHPKCYSQVSFKKYILSVEEKQKCNTKSIITFSGPPDVLLL